MAKRVVILSAFLTPFRSGAEACAEEVPFALKNEYEFVIITARLRRDLPHHDRLKDAISVIRVGLGLPIDKWLYPFIAPFVARSFRPDSVHGILETFAGLALLFCRYTVPKAKRILTLQTTNRTFLKHRIIRSADTVTAISSVLVDAAKKAEKDAVLIPNGIPYKALRDAASWHKKIPGRILFVGRLEPMKGVDTLLRAFAALSKDVTLRIVGSGSERSSLESLAQELGIGNRVTFAGYVSAPALYDEYAQAEIFCALSRSEALGNVFLEAQAAGCAVVATNVGGIPDIVHDHKNGLLVPPSNSMAATEALTVLLTNASQRAQFVEDGVRVTQQYDWQNIASRYSSLY